MFYCNDGLFYYQFKRGIETLKRYLPIQNMKSL